MILQNLPVQGKRLTLKQAKSRKDGTIINDIAIKNLQTEKQMLVFGSVSCPVKTSVTILPILAFPHSDNKPYKP